MAAPEDPTRPTGGTDTPEASEPTRVLPAGDGAEPTRVLPVGGDSAEPTVPLSGPAWAQPAPGTWIPQNPAPIVPPGPGGQPYGQFQPGWNYAAEPGQQQPGQQQPGQQQQPGAYGYGQQVPPGYGRQAPPGYRQQAPTGYGQQPGQAPYGQYAQAPYGQYTQAPYGQYTQAPGPQGSAPRDPYAAYSQHPGYYSPGQYYYPPQPVPVAKKRRWPLALAAGIVALVLAAGAFSFAARTIQGALPAPRTTTQPEAQPSVPSGNQSQPGGGNTTTGSAVAAAQSAGVVLIAAETGSGVAAGTGMIITADGTVLTNYHVVAGSEKVAVTVADTGKTYTATVVGFDQAKDVAVLKLKDASGLTTVRADDDQVNTGDRVAAVGNASGGGELVKAAGSVTATDQSLTVSSDSPWGSTEDLSGLIETNARAVPGDSGGPMFDSENEVLGMTTAGSTRARTSYAVPIATALAVVDQIETGQDAGTVRVGPAGYLGIRVADAQQGGTGKTITQVVTGSPADEAGVTSGSRLTKVGDTPITATTNLATVIRALEPGLQVTIEWTVASGDRKSATVTLGSSPVN